MLSAKIILDRKLSIHITNKQSVRTKSRAASHLHTELRANMICCRQKNFFQKIWVSQETKASNEEAVYT